MRIQVRIPQRGVLIHCPGAFWWCLADNIAHAWFRLPLDNGVDDHGDIEPWICRMHDERIADAARRHKHGRRARRIRRLGWGH